MLVSKTMQGLVNLSPKNTSSTLMPITRTVLHNIILALMKTYLSTYHKIMYKALFLLSYYACARSGEMVVSATDEHTIKLKNVQAFNALFGKTFKISFETYKHSNGPTDTILQPIPGNNFCPVASLSTYMDIRGVKAGPLFLNSSGTPLTREEYSQKLKLCASIANLPVNRINTHSFRIGRATQLASENASDATIRQVGRWKSSAFRSYIKPTHVVLPK